MRYTYTDEYLEIEPDQEDRAIKEIEKVGISDEFYKEKLVVLKTCIICCIENQSEKEDLYEIKLKHYKTEFNELLILALQNEEKLKGITGISKFNIPIRRG